MAVALILDLPGVTAELYDAVTGEVTADGWPSEIIAHYAGPTAGGWTVVDVWESREAFDRFVNEKLGRAMGEAGVAPPSITEIELHNQHQA